jgi:transposase-like protein
MSKDVQVISGKVRSMTQENERRRIVEESYASSLSLNRFAKKMGISPSTLCQWRKAFKDGGDCTKEEPTFVPMVPVSKCITTEGRMPNIDEILSEYQRLKLENEALKATDVEALRTENAKLKAEFSKFKAYAMSKIYEYESQNYA